MMSRGNKLLSIVVPVYKVEDYIDKCLSSLIVPPGQLEKLDVVVINDGTPDRSAEMARKYERMYPCSFRVIDQQNRGHGGAWNHGTELAEGKYLFYLDSDDWVDTAELSRLVTCLESCDTDMVLLDKKTYYAADDRYEDNDTHGRNFNPETVYDIDSFDWEKCVDSCRMFYAQDTVYRTSMMQAALPLFCEKVCYDDVSLQVIPPAIARNFIYYPINVYRYLVGRPGQSYDPKVRAVRAAGDVTKVIKFLLGWIDSHREIRTGGEMQRKWLKNEYQEIGTWHYRDLSVFGYKVAKKHLAEWDKYMKEQYPDILPDSLIKRYRRLPFPLYFGMFKVSRHYERCLRYIKRRLQSPAGKVTAAKACAGGNPIPGKGQDGDKASAGVNNSL